MITNDVVSRVKGMSLDEWAPIVQSASGEQIATPLADYEIEPISAPSLRAGTVALLKVSGSAIVSGAKSEWSCVLKVVDLGHRGDAGRLIGEREFEAYSSGLLEQGFVGIRPARALALSRKEQNGWIWLENLEEMKGPPWSLEQYAAAANRIGRFSGHWAKRTRESQAWMMNDLILDRWSAESVERLPGTSDAAGGATRVMDLISGKSVRDFRRLTAGLDALRPIVTASQRTLCNGDCHVRNVFLPSGPAAGRELVAIDWAGLGYGPMGTDVGTLVGSSLTSGDDEAQVIISGEEEIFAAYLDGLRHSGWEATVEEARLGYVFAAAGYGSYLSKFPVIIERQSPRWEFVIERLGSDVKRVRESCDERLQFVLQLVDEATA